MIKLYKIFLGLAASSAICAFATDDNPSYISFIKNKGQWGKRSLYEAEFKGGHVYLEKDAFTYVFYPKEGLEQLHHHRNATGADALTLNFHAVRMRFLGSQPDVKTEEQNLKSFYHNYYLGKDPAAWTSNVPVCETVLYKDLYNGISMKTFSSNNNIRYDFLVSPGADPSQIRMQFTGQNELSEKEGTLIISTSVGNITQQMPFAYQEIDGKKQKVDCRYKLGENNAVSFEIAGNYDKNKVLIIDPTLVFATFTGSTGDNWGMSASYDAQGNGYTAGIVFATGYPLSPGAFQQTFQGGVTNSTYTYLGFDIVASKFNTTGTNLLFSTYLGGTDNEQPQSIIVDNNDNLIIFGRSYSADFPVSAGAYDVSLNGGADIILTKFNPGGTALIGSTFVGGANDDGVNYSGNEAILGSLKYNYADDGRGDVILDNSNNVYVAACTNSNNFPVTPGCFQNINKGMQDACVFKMNPNLTSMTWSTYLGGSANDAAYSLGLDNNNTPYITGGTESANFPVSAGALHPAYMGNIDGFLTHLSGTGTSLLQSTYIGTTSYDQSYFVQLDNYDNVYIYGQTEGAYPVSAGVYSNPNSGQFIHEFNPTISSTVFSTVFGTGSGKPDIAPSAFLVDKCRNIYISGWGGTLGGYNIPNSTTFGLPVTSNAFQSNTDGMDFYFLVLQPNATSLWYATFFGGTNGSEEHVDGGTSRFDKSGVIYQAICEGCAVNPATGYVPNSDMPTTPGAWSATNKSNNCNNALVKFDFDLLQTVASLAITPSTAAGCAPFQATFTNQSQNAISFTWHFGDGDSAHTVNAVHTYTAAGSYTVTMVAKDTLSCNILDTIFATITVYPQPTLTVNSPTICAGSPATLTAGGASTYTWNTGATGASITQSPTVTTSYTVIGSDVHTCKDTITTNITVNPSPTVTVVGSATICTGATATLTASGALTYTWTNSATTSSITVSPLVTTQYTVTGMDVNGCKNSNSGTVTVNPSPTLTVNNPVICLGDTATITVNGASTYTWSNGTTTGTFTASPSANTNYTVTGTNSNLCVNTATTSISVNPLPVITASGDTVCAAVNAVISAGGGATYTWSTGNMTPAVVVSPTVTTVYTVTGADANGCVNTATTSVEVNTTPILVVNNDTICIGGTATLNASGGTTYTWSTSANTSSIQVSPNVSTQYTVSSSNSICTTSKVVAVIVIIDHTDITAVTSAVCVGDSLKLSTTAPFTTYNWNTGQTTPTIEVYNSGIYFVTTTDQFGCIGYDTVQVTQAVPVGWSMPNTSICEGQSAFLQEVQGNYIYNWHPTQSLNNSTIYNPTASPTVSTTYTCTITNGPCVTTNTVNVHVYPSTHLNVDPDNYTLLPGETVTLNASSHDSVHWSPAYGLSCTNCLHPVVTTDDDITYLVTSGDPLTGCKDSAYVNIIVQGAFYVPNTFTPNFDGMNDVFKPVATNVYDYSMVIYDRWGNHLFTTTDIDQGWNGFYKGHLCQEDVYVYKIQYSQKHTEHRKLLKGHINLVR